MTKRSQKILVYFLNLTIKSINTYYLILDGKEKSDKAFIIFRLSASVESIAKVDRENTIKLVKTLLVFKTKQSEKKSIFPLVSLTGQTSICHQILIQANYKKNIFSFYLPFQLYKTNQKGHIIHGANLKINSFAEKIYSFTK